MHNEISNIIEVLNAGGSIIYPTDTVWGLGCDACNEDAVKKMNLLKKRKPNSPLIVLLHDENQIFDYVKDVPDLAFDLIEMNSNPLTIIFEKGMRVAKSVLGKDGSIAIRLIKDESCKALLKKWRKPLVSTSVNLSGQAFAHSIDEMDPIIKNNVDAIYRPTYTYEKAIPSQIISLHNDGLFSIIRK